MKRIGIIVFLIIISMVAVNLASAHREDPVFSSALASFNSQKIVEFTVYTSYPVPSITISSCQLQEKINNVWQPVTSDFTLTNVHLYSDSYSAKVDYSGSITTGTYRVKFCPTADNHTATYYSPSKTY